MLDSSAFVQVGSVRLPDSMAGIGWRISTYIGGDALAFLGYGTSLGIMHAPIIGSPP